MDQNATDQPGATQAGRPASRGRRHVLVQATVPALDVDGRLAAIVGTILCAVATVITATIDDRRHNSASQWGLWTAVTGVGLGLLLLAYCELRRWQAGEPDADEAA